MEPFAFNLIVINEGEVNMPDGSNVRKKITDVLHKTQAKLLEVDEGDTQSLQQIVNVSRNLTFDCFRQSYIKIFLQIRGRNRWVKFLICQ